MSKKFSRLISVLLAFAVIFALPVLAGAADGDLFSLTGADVRALSGNWKDNFVGKLEIEVCGEAVGLGNNAAIISIGTTEGANDISIVEKSEAYITFTSNGNVKIEFELGIAVNHATTYYFTVNEDAFLNKDSVSNSAYTFTCTGNEIIETLNADPVALTPIQRLINWLKSLDSWFWKPLIWILEWFVTL